MKRIETDEERAARRAKYREYFNRWYNKDPEHARENYRKYYHRNRDRLKMKRMEREARRAEEMRNEDLHV